MDVQLRERVARAIHAERTATPWPEGDHPRDVNEREFWYAAADRAIAAMDDWWADDGFVLGPPAVVDVRPTGGVL
jgi:hypothetical protein